MAPDLGSIELHRELVEWLIYGADGDGMLQLLKATENKNASEIVFYIDIMLLTDYDPKLAEKFLFDFGQMFFVLNDVIQALLRSALFDTSSTYTENPLELIVRFYNHPSPPGPLRCPLKFEMGFISYFGCIVGCSPPEDVGKSDYDTSFVQTIRIQRLKIMPKTLDFTTPDSPRLLCPNQVHTLIVDREYVGMFHAGQFISGVGEIGLSGFCNDHFSSFVKAPVKKCLTLSGFLIYANSVIVVDHNISCSKMQTTLKPDDSADRQHRAIFQRRTGIIRSSLLCNQLSYRSSIEAQILMDWASTESILSEFAEGVVGHSDFLKPKIFLLLSLVSEPQESVQTPQTEFAERRFAPGEYSLSNGRPLSPHSVRSLQTNYTRHFLNVDKCNIEDQISLLFIGGDSRLSRLINWAFQLYPIRSKLTFYSNSIDADAIPEGSLILIQGNALTKKSHIKLLNKLTKTTSPDNPRTRSCIAWCLYPDPIHLTTTELKQLQQLSNQSTFQCIMSPSIAPGDEHDDKIADEAENLLGEIMNYEGRDKSAHSRVPSLQSRLDKARLISVRFTKSSRDLIKAFFLTARMKAEYSLRDLHLMIRCARAHARLHLRTMINVTDALVGIMLVEETRIGPDGEVHNILGFPSQRADPYCLHYESMYTGDSKPARFLSIYAHVLSAIRQYDPEFEIIESSDSSKQ